MARDPDALKIRKWAESDDVEDPEDGGVNRATGWDASHSQPGGALPKREHFNELHREETALGVELNVHGLLEWDTSISYLHPALVMGSDAKPYISVANSAGVDPVTDASEANWKPYEVQGPKGDPGAKGDPGNTGSPGSATPMPTGIILDFGGTTAPTGYLACDGAAVSRTTYDDLFAVIGTTWGTGDGSTTFQLPDLRGRAAIGVDGTAGRQAASLSDLGDTGGEAEVTLTVAQLAAHSHPHTHSYSYRSTATTQTGGGPAGIASSFTVSGTTGSGSANAGGGGPHPNMPPSAVVRKIIKT